MWTLPLLVILVILSTGTPQTTSSPCDKSFGIVQQHCSCIPYEYGDYSSLFCDDVNDRSDFENITGTYPRLVVLQVTHSSTTGSISRDLFRNLVAEEILLRHNSFTSVESDAFDPTSITLRILEISSGYITTFPFEIASERRFPQLTSLWLNDNRLTTIPTEAFAGYNTKLNSLDLSGNQISSIGVRAFSGLVNLTILNLEHNFLTAIPDRSLYFDKELKSAVFLFGSNSISEVSPDAFYNTDLLHLGLDNNSLVHLPQDPFMKLILEFPPITIGVAGNKLECNCTEAWLVSYYSGYRFSRYFVGATCDKLGPLQKQTLKSIGNCTDVFGPTTTESVTTETPTTDGSNTLNKHDLLIFMQTIVFLLILNS